MAEARAACCVSSSTLRLLWLIWLMVDGYVLVFAVLWYPWLLWLIWLMARLGFFPQHHEANLGCAHCRSCAVRESQQQQRSGIPCSAHTQTRVGRPTVLRKHRFEVRGPSQWHS